VPKTFAESLAPSENPRNRPLEKKINIGSAWLPSGIRQSGHAPSGALTPSA
jgi:hypothetical protein